jgi:hypothetical protein
MISAAVENSNTDGCEKFNKRAENRIDGPNARHLGLLEFAQFLIGLPIDVSQSLEQMQRRIFISNNANHALSHSSEPTHCLQ